MNALKAEKRRVHAYTVSFEANEDGGYTVTIPAPLAL
jgi:hypothetical protein